MVFDFCKWVNAQTGRWKHIFWIICSTRNTELTWQLFTLSISLPLPTMHSNMAARKKTTTNTCGSMWRPKHSSFSSIKKGFTIVLETTLECLQVVIFNLPSCTHHNMTVKNTFDYSHLWCPLPTKVTQSSSEWLFSFLFFLLLFFSFANFQQMCLTLGWKPG